MLVALLFWWLYNCTLQYQTKCLAAGNGHHQDVEPCRKTTGPIATCCARYKHERCLSVCPQGRTTWCTSRTRTCCTTHGDVIALEPIVAQHTSCGHQCFSSSSPNINRNSKQGCLTVLAFISIICLQYSSVIDQENDSKISIYDFTVHLSHGWMDIWFVYPPIHTLTYPPPAKYLHHTNMGSLACDLSFNKQLNLCTWASRLYFQTLLYSPPPQKKWLGVILTLVIFFSIFLCNSV